MAGVGPDRKRGRVDIVEDGRSRKVSARLNPWVVNLIDDNPGNDLEATLQDVADVVPVLIGPGAPGGSRRKMRGGGKTYDALKKLFDDATNKFVTTSAAADGAAAKMIEMIPAALKTIGAGAALKFSVNHPSLFANIVEFVQQAGSTLFLGPGGATWEDYSAAVQQVAGSFANLIGDSATYATSPGGAIIIALFIMKYRAQQAKISLIDLINSDAAVLGQSAQGGVAALVTAYYAQYSAFLKAYVKEGDKINAETLKTIASKAKVGPSGTGAKALALAARQGGVPAGEIGAQEGEDAGIALIPAIKDQDIKKAADVLANLPRPPPEKEAAKALLLLLNPLPEPGSIKGSLPGPGRPTRHVPRRLAAVGAPDEDGAAAARAAAGEGAQGGKRRKKTRRALKRRMTRRSRKYLVAPIFAY